MNLTAMPYSLQLQIVRRGFNPQEDWNWVIPVVSTMDETAKSIRLCARKCELHKLDRCDIFSTPYAWNSDDGGRTWSKEPQPEKGLEDIFDGEWRNVFSGNPKRHRKTGKILQIGCRIGYYNNTLKPDSAGLEYTIFQDEIRGWSRPMPLIWPETPYRLRYNGGMQRLELPDGDLLIPIYGQENGTINQYFSVVVRCGFDGKELQVKEMGEKLYLDVERGLYEPSLTMSNGRYFLTLRNDFHGYVATSIDGMNFGRPRQWTFDDDSDLGNYNTQQHWVTHNHRLFLVYTRRGANNDHMTFVRHRAPLFMAEVNPETLQVIRASEQIVIPDRGAKLGNFDVLELNEQETWLVESEWMEERAELISRHYGSDNSIFIVRLKWL